MQKINVIEKDAKKLITVVNTLLADYHARVAIYEMPSSILMFFEENAEQVNGDVVIVRDKNDEGWAALKRNECPKVLFVFSEDYCVPSYFSGVCKQIVLPKALIKRFNANNK
ncbi:MAG: hypothetical protein ACRDCT_31475 [Shewanella sp.]